MAKIDMLTDLFVRSVKSGGKNTSYSDGGNLYLRVTANGAKAWVFRYSLAGKVKELGLGAYPTRKLKDARSIRDQMRLALQNRDDPRLILKPKREAAAQSFKDYAADFIAGKKTEHRSLKAHAQWSSTIERYCGDIAYMAPADISYRDIELLVSQPALSGKRETCQRVLQRVRQILDYASKREGDPGRFNPALAIRLPKRKPGDVKHFAAAPYSDVPTIVAALREKDSTSALVLRFSIATAARSANARGALWEQIDGDVWTIPASLMKGGVAFRQPLNAEALAVLELAKAKAGNSPKIFPGPQGGLISDVAINKTLHGIYPGVTAHGFRSSFRQWGAEQTSFLAEALELCLAHIQTNRVVAAYQRSDLFDIRKLILASWSTYCNGISNVLRLVPNVTA